MENCIKKTWEEIYQKWFDLEKDFSGIQVSEHYNPKKHFAIIVAQGLTMNEVIIAMKKRFRVFLYTENLDILVAQNDRDTKDDDYIVFFNRNVEADEEFKNLSANQLKGLNHKGITLLERLLLEVLYFNSNKKHLDINNWTLCSGSRNSDENTPCVYWGSSDNELSIYWYYSDNAYDDLRSRVVVFFNF